MIPLEDMRCGLVALVGLPNAGKSTLMNALVGEKIGIVSNKPNTTRVTVRGVVTQGASQMVFMDTPGLNRSSKAFDRRLVQQAMGAAVEADIVVLLTELNAKGEDSLTPEMLQLAQESKKRNQKLVVLLTKVDKVKDKAQLLPTLTKLNELGADAIIPIAAIKAEPDNGRGAGKGSGVERVLAELIRLLPEGPWLFPEDMTTDMPLPLRLAELTREQAMRQLHQELPYGIGVMTGSVEEAVDEENGEPVTVVVQQLLVSKEQHKPMVLGKGGQMLQKIGTFARLEMQKVLGTRVRLDLHVKVAEKWLEREQWLREMGV